jgi:aryl-alcohol dehydrogenase-like predicted oxidoreductase
MRGRCCYVGISEASPIDDCCCCCCRVDPNTPVSETFVEMKLLVDEGKVRYVGISEATPDDIRAAHAACPLTAVQLEWSLWSR